MKKILIIIGKIVAALVGLYVIASIGFYFWLKNEVDFEFQDVSHESAYSAYIGQIFKTTKDSSIIKIEQDKGAFNGKQLIYSVMENRIEGSDFLLNETLPAGTTFSIKKFVRCEACDSNDTAAIIKITSTSSHSDAPVYFDHMELMVRNDWTQKIR